MDGSISREDLEQHLLFHRAMMDDSESYERIGGYMDILSGMESGERLSDPVDEAIRSVFSLVLENGIDPWEIDLSEFARVYSQKVSEDSFDMIIAGKLVLMAWKVLRMQSESTRTMSEPPVEDPVEEVDDSFFYEDEDAMIVPDATLVEAYKREPTRPVTMFELIDAFEDVRTEMEIQREREKVKVKLRTADPKRFDNKAHEEDDKRDVEEVWDRISSMGRDRICLRELYVADLKENLKTFVSVLHLARAGLVDVSQDVLPFGEIYLDITHAVPSSDAAASQTVG